MYNYDYKTTYNIDDSTSIDCYQKDFLSIMNIESFDNGKINAVFDYIYAEIKDNKLFENIFNKDYFYSFLGKDKWSVIPILFAFESLKYTHICLSEFFKTKHVSKEHMVHLEKSLEYLLKK